MSRQKSPDLPSDGVLSVAPRERQITHSFSAAHSKATHLSCKQTPNKAQIASYEWVSAETAVVLLIAQPCRLHFLGTLG